MKTPLWNKFAKLFAFKKNEKKDDLIEEIVRYRLLYNKSNNSYEKVVEFSSDDLQDLKLR